MLLLHVPQTPHSSSQSPAGMAATPATALPGPGIPCTLRHSLRAGRTISTRRMFVLCNLSSAHSQPWSPCQQLAEKSTHTLIHASPPSCPGPAGLACLQVPPCPSRSPQPGTRLARTRGAASALPTAPQPARAGDGGSSAQHGPSGRFTGSPQPCREGHGVRRWPRPRTAQSSGFVLPYPTRRH